MSKIITIAICILVLSTFLLAGCSSETDSRFQKRSGDSADFPRDRQFQPNRTMNITEEEMQKLFEERQQKSIESCKDKNEGDNCQLEGPQGQMEGICKIMEENLACTTDRPIGQIRQ